MSADPNITNLDPTIVPEFELRHDTFELAAIDLYRDIHKGIRSELFALTSGAASIDPSLRWGRAAIADHVRSVSAVLESHAHHEDVVIDPVLVAHAPRLAERINGDHDVLEAKFGTLVDLATEAVDTVVRDQRRLVHLLHLELSAFTSAYLAHQYLEERVVMPTLERAIGPGAVLELHQAIVGSIPPDEMAQSLTFMLPAMNIDDRIELLDGIRAGAPAEAFAGVIDLARSVLRETEMIALESRMALT